MQAKDVVFVNEFTDGVLDPQQAFKFKVKDGGRIIANTAPGCWGPMITPKLKGGHEVTLPVYVEGAEPGDGIAIQIESIQVTSLVTSSGNDEMIAANVISDGFVAAKCPVCNEVNPETVVKGIGPDSIVCKKCGTPITPFKFTNGYTMAFDDSHSLGLTLEQTEAEKLAENGRENMCTPENSIQNPIVAFAAHDIPGVIARVLPMMGQLGTMPSLAFPDSHNAGDFAAFLVGAEHDFAMTEAEILHRTDGHMDINRVRAGATVIAPVKVAGGGVYLGDMHAMQGDGEIAGHTTDVAGIVQVRVSVIKNLGNQGPILLPRTDDLPKIIQPLSAKEKTIATKLAGTHPAVAVEESLPISFVGTGANLNVAIENGLARAADLLKISVPEVMNRATISGSIEIGRAPGVVTVTFLVPKSYLKNEQLLTLIQNHYRS